MVRKPVTRGGGEGIGRELSLEREDRPEIGEDELEDDAPDEGRRADAEECEQPPDVVGGAAAEMRRDDAERQAEHDHQHAGDEDQLERGRQELGDVGGHRTVGVERTAEIAVEDVADEVAVLHRQRLVEVPRLAHRLDLLLGRERAERDPRRIAGDDAGDGEDQDRHADHHHDRRGDADEERAEDRVHAPLARDRAGGAATCRPARDAHPREPHSAIDISRKRRLKLSK